jgi:hypothetical protein
MEIPAAGQQVAEVLPAFAVERDHLTVKNCFLDRQLLAHPTAKLLESFEDVPSLGAEVAALPGDVQQAVAIVLGLEEPGGIVKRLSAQREQNRLDVGKRAEGLGSRGLLGSLDAAGEPSPRGGPTVTLGDLPPPHRREPRRSSSLVKSDTCYPRGNGDMCCGHPSQAADAAERRRA